MKPFHSPSELPSVLSSLSGSSLSAGRWSLCSSWWRPRSFGRWRLLEANLIWQNILQCRWQREAKSLLLAQVAVSFKMSEERGCPSSVLIGTGRSFPSSDVTEWRAKASPAAAEMASWCILKDSSASLFWKNFVSFYFVTLHWFI